MKDETQETTQAPEVKPEVKKEEKKIAKKPLRRMEPTLEQLETFMKAYLNNGGNVSQAAIAVHTGMSVRTALEYGNMYLQRTKDLGLARVFLEKQGYDFGSMIKVAIDKMHQSKEPTWWDRLMKLAGYEDFMPQKNGGGSGPAVVNIIGTQRSDAQDFGFADEAEVIEVKTELKTEKKEE